MSPKKNKPDKHIASKAGEKAARVKANRGSSKKSDDTYALTNVGLKIFGKLLLHEDNLVQTRIGFFYVVQAILLSAVTGLWGKAEGIFIIGLAILGAAFAFYYGLAILRLAERLQRIRDHLYQGNLKNGEGRRIVGDNGNERETLDAAVDAYQEFWGPVKRTPYWRKGPVGIPFLVAAIWLVWIVFMFVGEAIDSSSGARHKSTSFGAQDGAVEFRFYDGATSITFQQSSPLTPSSRLR